MLARYFIERFCRELRKKPLALAPDAIDALTAYGWRGNVRELQNCIERAVILCDGDTVHPRHLNLSFRPGAVPVPVSPWEQIDLSGSMQDATRRVIAEVEKRKIEMALREAAGNKARVADQLQLTYKMLISKMREHGIVDEPSA